MSADDLAKAIGGADWMRYGACRGHDPNLFFPERGDPANPARKICAACPVLDQCREWALHHVPSGTCGECAHHLALPYHSRTYHKCDVHKHGIAHSAASDIRLSWPACERFQPEATA